jgi:23S rRNA (cytidine1920-2'-O)/16S rRNA (cytidine1409-2'-O)-methyltransferase
VIRDPQLHSLLIGRFAGWCVTSGFGIRDLVASPILGAEGNREFLFWLTPHISHLTHQQGARR